MGSCGGDAFGTDGLTEIEVDGKFWGMLSSSHVDGNLMSCRFCWTVSSDVRTRDKSLRPPEGDVYLYLGRRKSREHARRAAIRVVHEKLVGGRMPRGSLKPIEQEQ